MIANDQGYLDTPQLINPAAKVNNKLTMMPGERYEVIIDFTLFAGQNLDPAEHRADPLGGRRCRQRQHHRQDHAVPGRRPRAVVDNSFIPAAGKPIRAATSPLVRLSVEGGTTAAPGVTIHKTRRLTLNEVIAAGGPLEILVNNTLYDGSKPRPIYTDPVTGQNDFTPITSMSNTSYYSELPYEGETEMWEIVNLTADAHPMHPHLVAFQVLNRQSLDVQGLHRRLQCGLPGRRPPHRRRGPAVQLQQLQRPALFADGSRDGRPRYVANPVTGVAPCVLGGNPDPAVTLSLHRASRFRRPRRRGAGRTPSRRSRTW